ncbi:MAG: CAP domain-containing protein [Methanoregulaceae archaeon]|nr:CAP domain-containing protein [Methanoregulaceae archaeon]
MRGETFSVAITVRNGGTAFSGSTSSAMYLSSDTTITPADIFLGSCSVPGISAGSSVSLTGTAMVPSSVPAGSYYLGVIIDSANTISEIDEGNNIAWDPSAVAITVPVPGSSVEEQIENSILSYINQERVNAGLQPLANNPTLTSVARAHSLDMKTRNFFSHSNPDGLDPFERMAAAGYTFSSAGENIAATSYYTLTSNPDDVARNFVQDMWMQSSGHRDNILGISYTETGIGVVYESDHSSSPYGFIATQVFARP